MSTKKSLQKDLSPPKAQNGPAPLSHLENVTVNVYENSEFTLQTLFGFQDESRVTPSCLFISERNPSTNHDP